MYENNSEYDTHALPRSLDTMMYIVDNFRIRQVCVRGIDFKREIVEDALTHGEFLCSIFFHTSFTMKIESSI